MNRNSSWSVRTVKRILNLIKEPQINLICRKHNIDWRLPLKEKIKEIINRGIAFTNVLINDIHKDGTGLTEKKRVINELCDKGLNIKPALKGITIDEKIISLIDYFNEIEKDEKVGISIDGYEKMLAELDESIPSLNKIVKNEFELQDEKVLNSNNLLDYNIKPRDVLDLIPTKELNEFCKERGISTRGEDVLNILDHYKDAENIYLENYENIGLWRK